MEDDVSRFCYAQQPSLTVVFYHAVVISSYFNMNNLMVATDIIFSKYPHLLLNEFKVRAVSYGSSFFPSINDPSAKLAGHKRGSVT